MNRRSDLYADAPCVTSQTLPAEAWFPTNPNKLDPDNHQAIRECAKCPAKAECVAEGIATDERWAIRGGLLPGQYAKTPAPGAATRLSRARIDRLVNMDQAVAELTAEGKSTRQIAALTGLGASSVQRSRNRITRGKAS